MRLLFTTIVFLSSFFIASAKTDSSLATTTIKIDLDVSKLTGVCNLGGASVVYLHSGVGTTTDTSVWEHIVGHWGKADTIGRMTSLGSGKYTICFGIYDYYKTATVDTFNLGGSGVGPMLAGQTPYNIGLVFREEGPCPLDGTGHPLCIEGKDTACRDIYIIDIPSGAPGVFDKSGNPFPAVTATLNVSCPNSPTTGIYQIPDNYARPNVYPNPFTDYVRVEFNLNTLKDSRLELYDLLGNKVADFTKSLIDGYNSFAWDGSTMFGKNAPAGVYFLKLQNGTDAYTQKVIKQ